MYIFCTQKRFAHDGYPADRLQYIITRIRTTAPVLLSIFMQGHYVYQ